LFAIQDFDEGKATGYIDAVYSEHKQFYNANWTSRGQDVFLKFLTSFSTDVIDISEGELLAKIKSDHNFAISKRSIHYAAVKQVWSTPTFFMNNVPLSILNSSSTLIKWEKVISDLFDSGVNEPK
jgi:hypothetical protein